MEGLTDLLSGVMKIGVQLPEVERPVGWAEARDIARTVEDCGFDSIWVGDHLLYRDESGETRGPWEAWTSLAALAEATSRVELAPLVAATSFHNPAIARPLADSQPRSDQHNSPIIPGNKDSAVRRSLPMLPMVNNMMSNFVSNGADACRHTQPDNTSLTERLAPFLLQRSQPLASTPHQLVASRKFIQPIVSLPTTVESKLRHRNLKRLAHLRNQALSSIRLNDELQELLDQSEVF